jgi:hypothetical protein
MGQVPKEELEVVVVVVGLGTILGEDQRMKAVVAAHHLRRLDQLYWVLFGEAGKQG